jgi:hypothetical protein
VRKKLIKALAAVIVFAAVATGAGTAFAYWKATGSGSGVATTGTMQPVTIVSATISDVGTSLLHPGGSANVVLKVHNPNGFPVHVVSINQITGQSISPVGASGTCSTTGVTYTPPGSFADIPSNPADSTITLTGAAHMDTSSDSGCQGARFDIPVTLSVKA